MRLKFDDLPVLLLEEVFECLNPIELFDIQYLNRYLYQVINKVINYNSIYSMYDNTIYGLYQERFIKENGKLIRHLNLSEKKLELINYCPNLTSIKFGEFIRSDYDGDYNCKITMKLPKLKKLILSTYVNSIKLLGLFSCCLDQIEFIEVNEFSKYDGEVKKVIKYFNADVVKKIELYYGGNLSLDGLDTIKAKFTKLKMLRLLANNNVFNSTKLDPAISFVSHLKLEIEGNLTVNFDINSLGNLQNLRSLKLLDNSAKILLFQDIWILKSQCFMIWLHYLV
ncbi:hypothetical protein K502DRAFT_365174 [Neoconidiobolus thromboides FSU 785]|nr:hypothetical protein K502DRAFT_365174 [Neoconidiobolus thromboides FSU 785]